MHPCTAPQCFLRGYARIGVVHGVWHRRATQKIMELTSQIMELDEVSADDVTDLELRAVVDRSPSSLKSVVAHIAETPEDPLVVPPAFQTSSAGERALIAQCIALRLPAFREVDFGGGEFTATEAGPIARAIATDPRLKAVRLRAAAFHGAAVAALLEAMGGGSHCRRLAVAGRLGPDAAEAICKALGGVGDTDTTTNTDSTAGACVTSMVPVPMHA